MIKKNNIVNLVRIFTIVGALPFLYLGLYAYFVLKRASIVVDILIFCGILGIIYFMVKDWVIKGKKSLNKSLKTMMFIYFSIFGAFPLWFTLFIILTNDLSILLKAVLFIGSLFFSFGLVGFLLKPFCEREE